MSSCLAHDGSPDRLDNDRDQSCQVIHNGRDADESVGENPFLCINVVGNSRVKSEFEVLQLLGKGGFGSVVKVSGCYTLIEPLSVVCIGNYTVREVLMKNRTRVWRNVYNTASA